MLRLIRYLWPLPWSALGFAMALAVRLAGGHWQIRCGALEAYGGRFERICRRQPASRRFEAITIGHVILGLDAECLAASRAHEQVHVRQYERWGVLFVPAYLGASVWLWWRGRHPYWDNPFEREAYGRAPGAAADAVE